MAAGRCIGGHMGVNLGWLDLGKDLSRNKGSQRLTAPAEAKGQVAAKGLWTGLFLVDGEWDSFLSGAISDMLTLI